MDFTDQDIEEELLYILYRLRKFNRMVRYWESLQKENIIGSKETSMISKYHTRIRFLLAEIQNEFSEDEKHFENYSRSIGESFIFPWSDRPEQLESRYASFKKLWPEIKNEVAAAEKKLNKFNKSRIEALNFYGDKNIPKRQKTGRQPYNFRLDRKLIEIVDEYNLAQGNGTKARTDFIHNAIWNYLSILDPIRLQRDYK